MGSVSSPKRSRAPSALRLLLLCLLGLALSAAGYSLRFVGPLSPGAVLVDPLADPRQETRYEDCGTAEPLATVPAAARPLRLVWVRIAYRGTVPAPDVEAASRWIEERFPVSEVISSVEDMEYGGQEGVDEFWWVLQTLHDRQQADPGAWYVGVLPVEARPASGYVGQALLYGPVVILDVTWAARLCGHELTHAIGGNPFHDACVGPCPPMLSTCGTEACMPVGSLDWLLIWARLHSPPAERPAGAYEWNRVTCRIGV